VPASSTGNERSSPTGSNGQPLFSSPSKELALFPNLTDIFHEINRNISELRSITEHVGDGKTFDILVSTIESIFKTIQAIAESIQSIVQPVAQGILKIMEYLGNLTEPFFSIIQGFLNIGQGIASIIQTIANIVLTIVNIIQAIMNLFKHRLQSLVQHLSKSLT
jgi:phage-related protein